MTRETRAEAPNWIKWLAKRALKSRTESNDSRNARWSPELNQMTRETRSEAPNWIKWLAKRALKPRTESNDSRNARWSPELNQLTRETRAEAPNWIKWLAKRALKSRTESNDSRNARWSPRTESFDSLGLYKERRTLHKSASGDAFDLVQHPGPLISSEGASLHQTAHLSFPSQHQFYQTLNEARGSSWEEQYQLSV